jgi:hypothetical protein
MGTSDQPALESPVECISQTKALRGVLETSTNVLKTGAFRINEQRRLLNTGRRTAQEPGRSMTVGALTSRYASSTTPTL